MDTVRPTHIQAYSRTHTHTQADTHAHSSPDPEKHSDDEEESDDRGAGGDHEDLSPTQLRTCAKTHYVAKQHHRLLLVDSAVPVN